MCHSDLCHWLSWLTFPLRHKTHFIHLIPKKFTNQQTFLISAYRKCFRLRSDWKITRGDWRNKEKIGHLSSPNNHWQHRNNKLRQQKFIPHAHAGLVGHLSWHSSSLALLPQRSLFFSIVKLELTSECKSWRNPDTPTENSTGSPVIPMPGNGGSSTETRNWERGGENMASRLWPCDATRERGSAYLQHGPKPAPYLRSYLTAQKIAPSINLHL